MFVSSFLFNKPSIYKLPNIKRISRLVFDRLPFRITPIQCFGIPSLIRLNAISNGKISYTQGEKLEEIDLKKELTTKCFEP